jgi:signal transduction histidine kinase
MGGGLDLVGQRRDGSTFPVEVSLNHVAIDGGYAIAFVTDTSARKQAEEALRQSHTALEDRTAELERRTLQLSRLASQLTLAEQNARRQLAKTLHDGLQQLLFSTGMALDETMKTTSEDDQVALLQRARADVREAVEAARTLSVNLFPPVLHVGGLPAALSWLAKRTQEQYAIIVNLTADPQANPVVSDVRILLFEAVRELLFNAVKHAGIDRVDVNLALGPGDTIHIQVRDDGVGFDPKATVHDQNQQQAGLGLFSIQERLALLGGHLDIQSAPGKGSRFTLSLPRTGLPVSDRAEAQGT